MLNVSSLRYRYNQFFILFVLCSLTYVMAQSIGSGTTNFQDNLYKKDFLIQTANLLRIKIGDRVFPVVLLGKDGWMYISGSIGELNYFQNITELNNGEELLNKLITFNQYLKSQGITLLIVVAPNKSTIYPDKLPEQIKPLSTQSELDKLISYRKIGLPVIVDLRSALRTARQNQDVFYKTDTHWNGYGAFAAYTTIIKTLGSSYPELKPYEFADLELVTIGPDVRDTPRMMKLNTITELSFFFTPRKSFVQTMYFGDGTSYNQFSSTHDSKLPTLLMFHDSQGARYLNYYLSMNFEKSYFIHNKSMPQYLTRESIQQFEPDIIIIEVVERAFYQLSNINFK